MPPNAATTRLSLKACLTSRPRPAPSASRTTDSRSRSAARTSSRLPTLAQAMRRSSPTATCSASSGCRTSPTRKRWSGVRPAPMSVLVTGYSRWSRWTTTCNADVRLRPASHRAQRARWLASQCARRNETCVPARDRTQSGRQTSGSSRETRTSATPRRPRGRETRPELIVRSTSRESLPKRVLHRRWLIIAMRSPVFHVSSSVNVRPNTARHAEHVEEVAASPSSTERTCGLALMTQDGSRARTTEYAAMSSNCFDLLAPVEVVRPAPRRPWSSRVRRSSRRA